VGSPSFLCEVVSKAHEGDLQMVDSMDSNRNESRVGKKTRFA